MDEKKAFDYIHNMLTDFNLVHRRDYLIKYHGNGCFVIGICPNTCTVFDIGYFYDHVPDIKVFKVKKCGKYLKLHIKLKIRD